MKISSVYKYLNFIIYLFYLQLCKDIINKSFLYQHLMQSFVFSLYNIFNLHIFYAVMIKVSLVNFFVFICSFKIFVFLFLQRISRIATIASKESRMSKLIWRIEGITAISVFSTNSITKANVCPTAKTFFHFRSNVAVN